MLPRVFAYLSPAAFPGVLVPGSQERDAGQAPSPAELPADSPHLLTERHATPHCCVVCPAAGLHKPASTK